MGDYNRLLVVSLFKDISSKFNFNDKQKEELSDILYKSIKDYSVEYNKPNDGSISNLIELYSNSLDMDGLSYQTIKNKKYTLYEFDRYISKSIEDITISDLRDFTMYKKQSCKATTINSIISRLNAFFTWLYEEEYITSNPSKKLKKVKEPVRIHKNIDTISIEKIRENCNNDRDRAIVELCLSSGIRVSELVNLNISDIDFDKNRINIIGKGDKERVVMFSDKAKYHVCKYLNGRNDNNKALFISVRKPYNRIGKRRVEKIISDIKLHSNIDKKVTPHTFRHTMATNMIKSGANITTVQKLLGHSNINTTLLYTDINMNDISQEYQKYSL